MLFQAFVIYLVVGFIIARVTLCIFPSRNGYRPNVTLVVSAITTFTLLWPLLVLLALWYNCVVMLDRQWLVAHCKTRHEPAILRATRSKPCGGCHANAA